MGVLAPCLCICERVLLQGAGQELVCVGGVLQKMCCLCMWGMGQPCWLRACEGDAAQGELTVLVANSGLGAAG